MYYQFGIPSDSRDLGFRSARYDEDGIPGLSVIVRVAQLDEFPSLHDALDFPAVGNIREGVRTQHDQVGVSPFGNYANRRFSWNFSSVGQQCGTAPSGRGLKG